MLVSPVELNACVSERRRERQLPHDPRQGSVFFTIAAARSSGFDSVSSTANHLPSACARSGWNGVSKLQWRSLSSIGVHEQPPAHPSFERARTAHAAHVLTVPFGCLAGGMQTAACGRQISFRVVLTGRRPLRRAMLRVASACEAQRECEWRARCSVRSDSQLHAFSVCYERPLFSVIFEATGLSERVLDGLRGGPEYPEDCASARSLFCNGKPLHRKFSFLAILALQRVVLLITDFTDAASRTPYGFY